MVLTKVLNKTLNVVINLFVYILGLFFFRSKRYVVIGSWMGEKYADNSRNLYEFLFLNRKQLKLKKVVWMTRSKAVYEELKTNGFDVAMIGTLRSFFYHCKSKIHILCNTFISNKRFKTDIDTRLSCGAFKIQLWHGNGIKKVPGADYVKNKIILLLKILSTPGMWHPQRMFFLCKSDLDVEFFRKKFNAPSLRCIDATYPRIFEPLFITKNEKEILSRLSNYSKIILYLPTFRNDYSYFVHPLSQASLCDYLKQKNIVWIEKQHSADDEGRTSQHTNLENVIILNDCFDINVLISRADLLITDYSSAMLDALFFRKQILFYVPDFEYFCNFDRGFLMDFDSITISPKVLDAKDIIRSIDLLLNTKSYNNRADNIRRMFWKYDFMKMSEIWDAIQKKINHA